MFFWGALFWDQIHTMVVRPWECIKYHRIVPFKMVHFVFCEFHLNFKKLLQNRLLPLPSDLAQVLWPGPRVFPSPDFPGVQLKNKLGCRVGGPTAQLCSSQWKKGW